MQFCLARLKLQFTIYNITTNISVEESWKCTVWPKVFFFFFVFFFNLLPKRKGLCQFSNSHLHYWGFTNVQFYSQKGLCPLTAGYICILNIKKAKRKILQSFIYMQISISSIHYIFIQSEKRVYGLELRWTC